MTLLQDVIKSYNTSIEPDKQIVDKINSLVEIIPENELIKRELIHTMNIVSDLNKEKCLLKFENIVKCHWNIEFNDIFFAILKSTNTKNIDVLLNMFEFLSNNDQNMIINNIYNCNLVNLEMKTCGIFLGKLYLKPNQIHSDIKKVIANAIDFKPYMIINVYITIISNEQYDLICKDILQKLKKMNLNTSTMMLLYDLEDLCTEKGI